MLVINISKKLVCSRCNSQTNSVLKLKRGVTLCNLCEVAIFLGE